MTIKNTKKSLAKNRRKAILDSALKLFLKKGYAAVSVDEIISKSGGSKSSLYEYFGTKEGLFREIVTAVSKEILDSMEMPDSRGMAPREVLTSAGMTICTRVLTYEAIGLYRLAVSSSTRFPKIARLFYEAGPRHGQLALAKYLKKETAAGRLNVKDPMRASEFFFGMMLVRDHIAMPLGCAKPPSKTEIKKIVNEAVGVFMAAYGK